MVLLMNELVKLSASEEVAEIVLNRPHKRNAINLEMYAQLDDAIRQVDKMSGVRALIIRGEGQAFSAGIDVTAFLELPAQYGGDFWRQRMRSITDQFQKTMTRLERLEMPVIVLLHGYCLGLAMELALAGDIRIAAPDTKLGLPETRLGMIPDVGGTTRLTRLVGVARAKEMIFSGGQYAATTLEKWGAVNYIVPASELRLKADELIRQIKHAAPLAVGMAKRVIDGLADIDRGLQLEGWAQSQLFQTEDFQEAIQAYMAKRPPDFQRK